MSKSRTASIATDLIRSLFADVQVPGSIDEFSQALTQPSLSAMRLRREIGVDDLPLPTKPIDWYRLGRRTINESTKPSRFLAYAAGDYYVQDAGSMLALAAAGAQTTALGGKLICDLCAAPGGKATALVEAVGDAGFVLANEVIGSRVGALQLNLARTGSDRYAVSNLDPDSLADRLGGLFDLVLVDAPCSGQAMLARGKQKTGSLSAKQIGHSAIRQNRILDAAVRLVRDGGQLVYSTCTFAEAENEAQVSRLIQSNAATPDPVDSLVEYQTMDGCYRLWPHRDDCAGAFAASLRIDHTNLEGGDQIASRRDTRIPDVLRTWYQDWQDQLRLHQTESIVYGWPSDAPAWVESLAVAGPELAHRVGQTWKPSHAAALRRVRRARSIQAIEIDEQQAQQFMRGEEIQCQGSGWHVVRWGDRPLGWIKMNGSIGKNHLPKSARVQVELFA
jgi:16S rRNA C967 or C1407 C5-methylase (RsmB/RsmF family)/NOL1/NOP2/fmu family ribosome biogenesis protein